MTKFDTTVSQILVENSNLYDFDLSKKFFIIPGYEAEFTEELQKLIDAPVEPLRRSGLPPSPRPMYQVGDMAGRMANPSMWASAILRYYDAHDTDEIDMKAILRNCRVKPTDMAIYNFYNDLKEYFGDIVEYKIPEKQKGVEKARTIKNTSGGFASSLYKAVFGKPKKHKPYNFGPSIK